MMEEPTNVRQMLDEAPMGRLQIAAIILCILLNALDGFDGLTLSVLALGGHPSHLRLDPFLTDGTDRTRHC